MVRDRLARSDAMASRMMRFERLMVDLGTWWIRFEHDSFAGGESVDDFAQGRRASRCGQVDLVVSSPRTVIQRPVPADAAPNGEHAPWLERDATLAVISGRSTSVESPTMSSATTYDDIVLDRGGRIDRGDAAAEVTRREGVHREGCRLPELHLADVDFIDVRVHLQSRQVDNGDESWRAQARGDGLTFLRGDRSDRSRNRRADDGKGTFHASQFEGRGSA
jgi:hypothetical protein